MKRKIISITISIIFIALIGFNATFLNVENLFSGNSFIALMSIIATLCALVLLWILILGQQLIKKNKE